MKNGTVVEITNTMSELDGLGCTVVGIVFDCRPAIGSIFVLKPLSGKLIRGYETICMSDACLNLDC